VTHDHAVALLVDLRASQCELGRATKALYYRDDQDTLNRFAATLREWAEALEKGETT
jgi:hypothetical protein